MNPILSDVLVELFGLLITLLFVQRFLERQERARRLRGSVGAVRRAGRALAALAGVAADLVKGSLDRAPHDRPTALPDLLAGDLTAALVRCDAAAACERLAVLAEARRTLREVVARAATVDPLYLGALDDLIDDPFLTGLIAAAEGEGAVFGGPRPQRESFVDRLLLAIELHNEIAAEAARLRDRRTAPRARAFTAEIAPDADLRVPTTVPAEWWSVAPRPGSLRVRFRDAGIPVADGIASVAAGVDARKSLPENDIPANAQLVRNFPSARAAVVPASR